MNKIKYKSAEKQLLTEAIKLLSSQTGSRVKELALPNGNEANARITIALAGVEHHFNVAIKGEIRQNQVLDLIAQFGKNKDQWLLIARYIPKPLKDNFKSLGINYLEAAGNCYIQAKGIFIYVADQKVTPTREAATGKLWNATGLKFMMAVINNPALLNASYREIATAAGIALGNIGPLLDELQQGGYTNTKGNVERLVSRDKLITRWTEMFHAIIRPKLQKGRFRFLRTENAATWQDINDTDIYWGGEPGAALLTGHITPENFTLYSGKPGNELLKLLGMVPDNNGNIVLLDKCWGTLPGAAPGTAPALLIYADLAHGLDSRNKELAERIKTTYLNGE
ncbi:type IV toxin-antitoxin system AbiEi family antitoxin [Deminuibacter soli]|nr:type IV toxin-antitoxin system AbiEi family antitoxin [Deminuibacter soli]